MSDAPLVSVIVAVYNQRSLLPLVLKALLAQQHSPPFEVLICDDGSSDGSLEVISEIWKAQNFDVRYIWQPDSGFRLSRSRNNAIRCAQGKFLVFLDGDMWPGPTFLRDHLAACTDEKTLVLGRRQTIWLPPERLTSATADEIGAALLKGDSVEFGHQAYWIESSWPWMTCIGATMSLMKAPAVAFDERFVGRWSEDRDFACQLTQRGYRPVLLPAMNAVQLEVMGQDDSSSVWRHEAVAASLRNKLLLRAKYPAGEMAPTLTFPLSCHLDAATDTWSVGARRRYVTSDEVLLAFQAWADRNGYSLPARITTEGRAERV